MDALDLVFPADLLAAAACIYNSEPGAVARLYELCQNYGLTEKTSLSAFEREIRQPMLIGEGEYAKYRLSSLRRAVLSEESAVFVLENEKSDSTGSIILRPGTATVQLRSGQTFIYCEIPCALKPQERDFEAKFHEFTADVFQTLEKKYDESFTRYLRRKLPITGVRIDWDAV